MTKFKRTLEGYAPAGSAPLTTVVIPEYLWPVAMALAEQIACPAGHYDMTEAKARALATAMGCVLPDKHMWSLAERPTERSY